MPTFDVEGMSCAHCVRAVTSAINRKDSAASVSIDLAAKTVSVSSTHLSESVLRDVIESEDFHVVAIHPDKGVAGV